MRGEYLYVAEGAGGFRVYDIANIGNKGVSQRIIRAPYSPQGHQAHVKTTNATCMALATNQPVAPQRNSGDLMRKTNLEQAAHPIYHYAFIVDATEGLIVVNIDTLADGDAKNNFLSRSLTWNPQGALSGASHIVLGGYYAYVATPKGIQIVNLEDPLKPRLGPLIPVMGARSSALQFRYLFITSPKGLEVVDISNSEHPVLLPQTVPLADARRVYLARTYAYVAAGREGLAIIDIEKPHQPHLLRVFNADGAINDARDVIVGSTNASLFAYVADGRNGLKVIQLTSPETQPKFYGFSPEPVPQLIAWRKTRSPAMALSKGLDRDRAVDETGGQIAIFGRLGSRPFNRQEMDKLYLTPTQNVWTVEDIGKATDFVPLILPRK
jgi:hypothetical protein